MTPMNTDIESNLAIVDAIAKLHAVMAQNAGKKIVVSYSGGADSDTVMHLLRYAGYNVTGVFFDTGIEYQATYNHVEYMRSIGFDIVTVKAKRPIPTSQKKYGNAFINKRVSEMLSRLQRHKFDFQQHGMLPFDELTSLYPRCRSALRWWCNHYDNNILNVANNRWLKEFLTEHGLPFAVSGKCCDGAKKLPSKEYAKEHGVDMMLLGIRRSEGGQRKITYKNCFVPKGKRQYDMFFPLYWWTDEDKKIFNEAAGVVHSEAYTKYGLKRTGCSGCPFGSDFENELRVIDTHEPKLSKGIRNIFGKAYEWTRLYKQFVQRKNAEIRQAEMQRCSEQLRAQIVATGQLELF